MTRYRFIGKDGSMGLKHSRIYNLKLTSGAAVAVIARWNARYWCPYKTIDDFTDNWQRIETKPQNCRCNWSIIKR